jgi:2-polyprenyl-3-methyl-5-hydroxy-6-metoxy-1,4-benzoquinol methylase
MDRERPTMKSQQPDDARIEREAKFHDAWALSTNVKDILVTSCFEAPTAVENMAIIKEMGPLKGKKVLDIGAGLGESSVYFALRGAIVTTTDLSPEMVKLAIDLGKEHGVELEGIVSSAEGLNVPENTYDIVYVANTIHHVTDKPALFGQIRAALKPGGRFFSIDPIAYNPAITVYRMIATEVRSVDEYPLRVSDLKLAKRYFVNVKHREFWFLTLSLFFKYYLIDRVHPNADRFWKRIFKETPKTLWWWMPLRSMDTFLTRIPILKWLCWNMVMWGEKPKA